MKALTIGYTDPAEKGFTQDGKTWSHTTCQGAVVKEGTRVFEGKDYPYWTCTKCGARAGWSFTMGGSEATTPRTRSGRRKVASEVQDQTAPETPAEEGTDMAKKAKKAMPKARAAKAAKVSKEPTAPRPIAFVTPGINTVTAVVYDVEAQKVLIETRAAMDKAGAECSAVMQMNGQKPALLVLATLEGEGNALRMLRRKVRDAAKEPLRAAGYVVHR